MQAPPMWLVAGTALVYVVLFAFYGSDFWGGETPELPSNIFEAAAFFQGLGNLFTVGVFDNDIAMPPLLQILLFLGITLSWLGVILA